jgi:hypothetical protein
MSDVIQAVYQWQSDAGNLDRPYDDFLESSFQIEEALEGFGDVSVVADAINREHFSACVSYSPRDVARGIVSLSQSEVYDEEGGTGELVELSNVARFDKHVDGLIYHIGSLGKLGLSVDQICRGILAVNQANYQKLNAKRDAHGKLGKPADFIPPEEALQQILDER